MKKIAKMSLVAAMAISGLTSASAADLTEAIKGVKVSGFVSYTMEKVMNDDKATSDVEAQHDIDIRIQAVIPVNDMVTATIRIDEANDDDHDNTGLVHDDKNGNGTIEAGEFKKGTSNNASSLKMEIDRAYFTYTNSMFSSSFGLMSAPLTDGANADGISFSKNLGPVALTVGYAYSNSATSNGADDLAYITANGSIDPVSYYVTYVSQIGTESAAKTDANFLHLGVSGNIKMISLGLDYAQKTGIDGSNDENQFKVSIGADLGAVSLGLAYAANDKDGGETTVGSDDTAASNITVAGIELQDHADASAIQADISFDINATNNVKLTYVALDQDLVNTNDMTAYKLTYTNKMSSNFSVYANYELTDTDNTVNDMSELTLGAKYSF